MPMPHYASICVGNVFLYICIHVYIYTSVCVCVWGDMLVNQIKHIILKSWLRI